MTRAAQSGGRILCIGAAHWDVIGHAGGAVARGDDLPGRVHRAPGGVALNLALWLRQEGLDVDLLSALGDDAAGRELLAQITARGIGCDRVLRMPGQVTGSYVAIEDAAGLVAAVADTAAMDAAGPELLASLWGSAPIRLTVIDGNLDAAVLTAAAALPALGAAELCMAGASPAKARQLRGVLGHPTLALYLNRAEAGQFCGTNFDDSPQAALGLRAMGAAAALVTDGARPAAWADATDCVTAEPPRVRAARITGAGDCVMAAHIAARLRGLEPETALAYALERAAAHISLGTLTCMP